MIDPSNQTINYTHRYRFYTLLIINDTYIL